MKVGVRAHDYGRMGIEEMARLLRREGFETAQLVLPKAFSQIESYEAVRKEHLEQIRAAFEENHVEIGVLGCYMDLGNPDPEVRAYGVQTLKKALWWAKELGAGVVGTETAYPRLGAEEKARWRPFMIDSILRVVDEAQRADVKLAIEPVYWHPLESLEVVEQIVRRVDDSRHLRLIFDAANQLEFPESTDQEALWSQWLEAVGQYVDVLHIKDFTEGEGKTYQPKPLGTGVMRYQAIESWLENQKREISLIREELDPRFAREDLRFMKRLAGERLEEE